MNIRTLSLLLSYASYRPKQVWKKMGQIYKETKAKRGQYMLSN
jgi:hypothetical protein